VLRREFGQKIYRRGRLLALSGAGGVLAGLSATLFLYGLKWATDYREAHPMVLFGLPLAGLLIGWAYYLYGKDITAGNNLIIDEIHQPSKVISFRMAPFIFVGTVATHFFGGSAGREGTAVQMGASLSDQLTHFFKVTPQERKVLLAAGAGAGFGAAIGAPFAGALFGMEMNYIGRFKVFALIESLAASFFGYWTTLLLSAPHTDYAPFSGSEMSLKVFLYVALAGVLFGILARVFVKSTHLAEGLFRKVKFPPFKPFLGGLLLLALYALEGSYRYDGLGLDVIQRSLLSPSSFLDPLYKAFFTVLTVSTGFKGGEFIPMVFMGATLGSALSLWIPASLSLLSSVGFASVFGAASKTPLACTVMAMEIFGWRLGPFALVSCFVAYFVSGSKGIYSSQKSKP